MTISPADPSTLMGRMFGESVRPFRQAGPPVRPATGAEIASLALAIEETVANGLAAYQAILRFDLSWRGAVFEDRVAYDPAIDRLIADNLREWADNAAALLGVADATEGSWLPAAPFAGLRAAVAEVEAMLTPDDEFFEGEGLDRLADDAIAADERGETVEFRAPDE